MYPFKGKIKSYTIDKYLAPIRSQIIDLVKPSSSVIEFGCGNGDLLLKLSTKISAGLGIDKSSSLIKYADTQKELNGISNINFSCLDIEKDFKESKKYDYAIASLLFHVMPLYSSDQILKITAEISPNILICAFSPPESLNQKMLLWMDQRFSGHYNHFLEYQKNGYMEGLLREAKFSKVTALDTFDPVIKIYKIIVS